MKTEATKEDGATAKIGDNDLALLSESKNKLTQGDILRKYVKNYSELDLKQRRQVMGHIQAQRAMHAKEIFLKELATLGKRLNK